VWREGRFLNVYSLVILKKYSKFPLSAFKINKQLTVFGLVYNLQLPARREMNPTFGQKVSIEGVSSQTSAFL
jgi:hypothetical protein